MDSKIDDALYGLLPTGLSHAPAADLESLPPIYPELLLHKLPNVNKLCGSFQHYTRQFSTDTEPGIVQFSSSHAGFLLAQKVHAWDLLDQDQVLRLSSAGWGRRSATGAGIANLLFSWASGEKDISARKLELQNKGSSSSSVKTRPTTSSLAPSTRSRPLMTQRITNVVEKESNRFIQDRIQVIKAHHIEQASRKIDERKKRDHALYLTRIKNKEYEYAKKIKAAIASKDMEKRSGGILGSMFGFTSKNISSSFIFNIDDDSGLRTDNSLDSRKSSVDSALLKPAVPTPKSNPVTATPLGRASSSVPPQAEPSPHETKGNDPYLPSVYLASGESLPNSTFASQDLLLL